MRAALKSSGERVIAQTAELLEGLVKQGKLTDADRHLRSVLAHSPWWTEASFAMLESAFLRHLAAARVDAAAFERDWRPFFSETAPPGAEDAPSRLVARIDRAYKGGWGPVVRGGQIPAEFRPLRHPRGSAAFAEFLKMIGDHHARGRESGRGDPKRALECYSLAFTLEPENTEAGIYTANVLLNSSETVDPEHRVIDEMIGELFAGKGSAYLGQDWEAILRFHTVLGQIFEKQGRFEGGAHSARFQWEHALAAHERLASSDPSRPKIEPAIHSGLARTYAKLDRGEDAWKHYLQAAEGFEIRGRKAEGRSMIEGARALRHKPNAEDDERLNRLNLRLRDDRR